MSNRGVKSFMNITMLNTHYKSASSRTAPIFVQMRRLKNKEIE